MRRVLAALFVVTSLWATAAVAQVNPGVEIMPFAGYRWGGSMSTITGLHNFDVQDTWSYGITLDKMVQRTSAVELYYAHFTGDAHATVDVPGNSPGLGTEPKNVTGTLNRDDIHLNGVWYAYRYNQPTRPYFTAGLGTSISSGTNFDTVWRFSWNLGAGIRHDLSSKAALRLEGRWLPVWVTTGSAVYCDPWYCYGVGTGESFDQFALTLGLSFAVGR